MKKFRTVASVITMVIAGTAGFFIGAALNNALGGAILFSMIAGIACVIYTIDNQEKLDPQETRKNLFPAGLIDMLAI